MAGTSAPTPSPASSLQAVPDADHEAWADSERPLLQGDQRVADDR
jgi:hypothetical protein